MAIPVIYNVRSLRRRPVLTLTTAAGMALVVTVLIAMLALSEGFRAALARTGSPENALVLRRGADSELSSGISREAASIIAGMPFVARAADGRPLSSPELYVVINLNRLGTGGLSNVVVRGVNPAAFEVRKDVRVVEGRMFRPGASEIIIGRTIAGRFAHCGVGDRLAFAGREWDVVGHFTAGGSAFESEIWGENESLMPVLRGEVFQSVTFRMQDASAFDGIENTLEKDPRLQVDVHREFSFYANQSLQLTQILNIAGVFITSIMGVGAVFGAVNTMFASVSARSPEIAVLLTLGFRPSAVALSFLAESMLIALAGGVMGCLLSLTMNGVVTSTTNWASFSEVAFTFEVTPQLLAAGMVFAAVMGVVGGIFPALRAARRPIVQALREI